MIYCNKLSKLEGRTPCYSIRNSGSSVNYTADQLAEMTYNDSRIPTSMGSVGYTAWRDSMVCNFSANGYRLPTETEWEYAARGGASNAHPVFAGSYFTGNYDTQEGCDSLALVGWFGSGTGHNNGTDCVTRYGTKPVKEKRANIFGLYDMSGNVNEWCWGSDKTFPLTTPTVATVHSGTFNNNHEFRGGFWLDGVFTCRVSTRFVTSDFRSNYFGMRLVVVP